MENPVVTLMITMKNEWKSITSGRLTKKRKMKRKNSRGSLHA